LINDTPLTLNMPKDLTEDMTNDTVDMSWLKMRKFTDKSLSLLESLLANLNYNISKVDCHGKFQWDCVSLCTLCCDLGALSCDPTVSAFIMPRSFIHGTKFANGLLSNALIMWNMFENFGTWFIYNHFKTSGLTESLSWVPNLCPKKLGDHVDISLS
ncbi:hypothetical protein BKA93DRAFT_734422, partial [Sparassis latifolia]